MRRVHSSTVTYHLDTARGRAGVGGGVSLKARQTCHDCGFRVSYPLAESTAEEHDVRCRLRSVRGLTRVYGQKAGKGAGGMAGRYFEVQPDDRDVLCNVVFEDAPLTDEDGRQNWMVDAALDVLQSAGYLIQSGRREEAELDLHQELQLRGEELFWYWIERQVRDMGFDVYSSDSLFEVYAPTIDTGSVLAAAKRLVTLERQWVQVFWPADEPLKDSEVAFNQLARALHEDPVYPGEE